MNKHYERIDEKGYVIKGFSDAFEQPIQGDICVNEQGDRHYNPVLYDEKGCHRFKYVVSERINITEQERLLEQNSKVDIDALKQEKILESKSVLATWLSSNPLESNCHNETQAYYSVTFEKQSQLTQLIMLMDKAKELGITFTPAWNAAGQDCEVWTYQEIYTLTFEISAYVLPRVSKQRKYETEINNMSTVEEIESMMFDYATVE
jgi:hypothetical protein